MSFEWMTFIHPCARRFNESKGAGAARSKCDFAVRSEKVRVFDTPLSDRVSECGGDRNRSAGGHATVRGDETTILAVSPTPN